MINKIEYIESSGWMHFHADCGFNGGVPVPSGHITSKAIINAIRENNEEHAAKDARIADLEKELRETKEVFSAESLAGDNRFRNALIVSLAGNPSVVPTWISPNDGNAYPNIKEAPDETLKMADAIIAKIGVKV
jgi:hypothetical protein